MSKLKEATEAKMSAWMAAADRWEEAGGDNQLKQKQRIMRPEFVTRETLRAVGTRAIIDEVPCELIDRPTRDPGKEVIIGEIDWTDFPQDDNGRRAGRPVARITTRKQDGTVPQGFATGVLIGPRLLMTNHHVFEEESEAENVSANFLFERTTDRGLQEGQFFDLAPGEFFWNDKKLDCVIVALAADPRLANFTPHYLIGTPGKLNHDSHVRIIQHPSGEWKRYAEKNNWVVGILKEGFIHYVTDTLPGSSGSAGFNDHWEFSLLHQGGVPAREGENILLREDKQHIARYWKQGIPEDYIKWVANVGSSISAIVAAIQRDAPNATGARRQWFQEILKTVGDPVVHDALATRKTDSESIVVNTDRPPGGHSPASPISPPTGPTSSMNPSSNPLETHANVSPVTINVGGSATAHFVINSHTVAKAPAAEAKPQAETGGAQATALESVIRFDPDYESRKGYNKDFLSIRIPAPRVASERLSEIYEKNGSPFVLNYHHYSVVINKDRRLMMWSAVNVDYRSTMRDNLDRDAYGSDKWIPDPRLPGDLQIQDPEFYKPATLVDRGHIVRRADNVWGSTKLEREYSNSDTFHWPNCTPQHEYFNRGDSGGLWGQFEDHIVTQIVGFGRKISIFAGPILDSNDPEVNYGKGNIQYPVRFWKVIAGVENGQLFAYGFILDQSGVIRRRGLEKEAFDPGRFGRYQYTLRKIAKEAGIIFPRALLDADVLAGAPLGQESIELPGLEAIRLRSPWLTPIENYDASRYGPLLGVSDEGSAARAIATAAWESAKAKALPGASADSIGLIIDGERMSSSGEVPIGPEEYDAIVNAATDRTHCSTNVGTRLNARFYQPYPEYVIPPQAIDLPDLVEKVVQAFKPFVETPDGQPRPLTVRLVVDSKTTVKVILAAIEGLEKARDEGKLADPQMHRLTLSTRIDTGSLAVEVKRTEDLIGLAAKAGVPELVIGGAQSEDAQRRILVPGLLNLLDVDTAGKLLASAAKKGVRLAYLWEVDIESAARSVWTGLYTAEAHGLNAGKFGLLPLTLEQQVVVVERVLRWTKEWTAIPAYYVDTPLYTDTGIYPVDDTAKGLKRWMELMKRAGARVVLVDCPDRLGTPRRLMKTEADDSRGVLTPEQVKELQTYARELGLKVFWSGGITPRQATILGTMKVDGIFTTSSTAKRIGVGRVLQVDPNLAAENEPTIEGVQRIHALIQAGFLVAKVGEGTAAIESAVNHLIAAMEAQQPQSVDAAFADLQALLIRAWPSAVAANGTHHAASGDNVDDNDDDAFDPEP